MVLAYELEHRDLATCYTRNVLRDELGPPIDGDVRDISDIIVESLVTS